MIYAQPNTFAERMKKIDLVYINYHTMLAHSQIEFMFNLVDCSYVQLTNMITKMKNNHISYVPDNKEEVEYILSLKNEGYFKWKNIEEIESFMNYNLNN
jgi:hypothetical protein